MRVPKPQEIRPLVRSGALAAILPLVIKFMSVPRLLSLLEPKKTSREPLLDENSLAHLVDAAVRRGPRFGVGECLIRSMVMYNLLRRFAYNPVLQIGGKMMEGDVACHSWIEIDGEPLREFNDPREVFKVLYTHQVNSRA